MKVSQWDGQASAVGLPQKGSVWTSAATRRHLMIIGHTPGEYWGRES